MVNHSSDRAWPPAAPDVEHDPLFSPQACDIARIQSSTVPLLSVVIDTEEEFDWRKPLSRENVSVKNLAHQHRLHYLFNRYNVKPTYLVDYAVASRRCGFLPLREFLVSSECDIGTHLHPWVNPPFEEEVNNRNSYAGNLPRDLELEKLRRLTEVIEQNLGTSPRVFRAGRYGVGSFTPSNLLTLGYEVDSSVVPWTDFSEDDGPDFRKCSAQPYWLDANRTLLEVPLTTGYTGVLARKGPTVHRSISHGIARRLRMPGIFARSGILNRVRLTPEGVSLRENVHLTKAMRERGIRVFVMSYHSASLLPGSTPYVRTSRDLDRFVDLVEGYLEFFFGVFAGQPSTLMNVKEMLSGRNSTAKLVVKPPAQVGET